MTLYEMKDSVKELYELLQNEVIDEQTFNDTVEGIGLDDKLEGYCQIIRQYEAEASAYKAEADRCRKRAEACANNVERMKQRMADFMAATGQVKAKAGTFSVSLNPSTAVEILDPALIPRKYYIKQDPKLDRAAIRDALKAGIKVKGAAFSDKKNITIR